jgi:hypothetical protein
MGSGVHPGKRRPRRGINGMERRSAAPEAMELHAI